MPNQLVTPYPSPWLRTKSVHVDVFGEDIKQIVIDMLTTMEVANGLGISAVQVNIGARAFVVHCQVAKTERHVEFINPVLLASEGERICTEGCLSLPGCWVKVKRATKVKIRAEDIEGKYFIVDAEGDYAQVLQHELDHLDGVLIVDQAGPVKRGLIHRKLKKHVDQFIDYSKPAWVQFDKKVTHEVHPDDHEAINQSDGGSESVHT